LTYMVKRRLLHPRTRQMHGARIERGIQRQKKVDKSIV
jgi:hypothetical protein